MAAARLLSRPRSQTQADLSIPNRQPRGAVQLADGIKAYFAFLLGSDKRLRDVSGNNVQLYPSGSVVEGAESVFVHQDSGVQGLYTESLTALSGKAVTIVWFGTKDRLSATTDPYKSLFAFSDSSNSTGSSTWRVTLGNDFAGAGTKESIRLEGASNSTGLYINGVKQAGNQISDVEYAAGASLNVVGTVSALPASGNPDFWVGSNGSAHAFDRGMKGHCSLAAIVEGELSEAQCLALSAGDYSVLFKPVNEAPFLYTAAGGSIIFTGAPATLTPEALAGAIAQTHALAAAAASSDPESLAGALAQTHALSAAPATLTPEALAGAIAMGLLLVAAPSESTPEALAGAITQAHTLAASPAALSPESLAGALSQTHLLVIAPSTLTPEALAGAIAIAEAAGLGAGAVMYLVPLTDTRQLVDVTDFTHLSLLQ